MLDSLSTKLNPISVLAIEPQGVYYALNEINIWSLPYNCTHTMVISVSDTSSQVLIAGKSETGKSEW